jgi:hypothetical protein
MTLARAAAILGSSRLSLQQQYVVNKCVRYIFCGLSLLMSPICYSLWMSGLKPKENSARNQLSHPRWLHGSELNVLFDTLSRTASLHFQSNIHSNLIASTHRAMYNNRAIQYPLYLSQSSAKLFLLSSESLKVFDVIPGERRSIGDHSKGVFDV